MTRKKTKKKIRITSVGLPQTHALFRKTLQKADIDPERLSFFQLGSSAQHYAIPPSLRRLIFGFALWLISLLINHFFIQISPFFKAGTQLVIGLIILQATCEILVSATEKLSARFKWNHYTAGTLAEIFSTTPELVLIAFIIPVSPLAAFTISVITIYNNALVFSLYSFFLPKDKQGKFLMPNAITAAGTQILIAGGAMGLILGLVMLAFNSTDQPKNSFNSIDLIFTSIILFVIFGVYLYKLINSYAKEETELRENLSMSDSDVKERLEIVYENVVPGSFTTITIMFLIGMLGAVVGGEQISSFAATMIADLQLNPILTALILAIFAGMSEYVILWQSHRKQEYGIALANAFGGITQVMFLVLPFTLLGIGVYQYYINPAHPELPLQFSLPTILLLIFLFPTFHTLSSLLEEDHTLGLLDTTIMTGIFLFLIVLLATHGGNSI